MPIHYTVDHAQRLVLVKGVGIFSDDDVFGYQREIMAREDVLGYDELVDMTNVLRIDVPSFERVKDLAKLSASADSRHPPGRFVIVAPGDIAFMLGRLFKGIRAMIPGSIRELAVFRTMEEAQEFLGRPRSQDGPGSEPGSDGSGTGPDGGKIG